MAKKKDKRFHPQFRHSKNANRQHPTYIFAKNGDDYEFIGITHSKITNGIKNIPLEKNPNPRDSRSAYIRPCVEKDKKKNFGKREKDWRFADEDVGKVKSVIKRHKKKK